MEIKLFVRTHKDNFGSVLLFSNNMQPKEKRVMEDIKYTAYDPDETEIIEISVPGFFIYFCTYIGGQDEFGRDYQNVIGTIFPFRITESDVLNLRKTFADIMKDISSSNFSEENRYFSEIKAKASINYHSKTGNFFFRLNLKKVIISIFLLICLVFVVFKLKNQILDIFFNKETSKISEDFDKKAITKYVSLMTSIYREVDTSVKYKLYKELMSEIEKSGEKIKQFEAEKKYNLILTEYNKKNKDNTSLNLLIKEYLENNDFKFNFEKVKSIQTKIEKGNELYFLKNINSKVSVYNNKPTNQNLIDLINSCKNIAPMLSEKERAYVENIILQSELIQRGVNSELEVHISEKSAVFNRRTLGFEIKIDKQEPLFKSKPMDNDPNIYAGSFFVRISPLSKIKVKIFDHSYSGKKILLKEKELEMKDLNNPFVVNDGRDNSFKVELRVILDKFKIKFN
jgi:hypothetical protein